MAWEQGRDVVDDMLQKGALVLGDSSATHVETILESARRHLESTMAIVDVDPAGGHELAYEAASKALVALLVAQRLYPANRADRLAVYDAVSAQFEPPFGPVLSPYLRLRARHIEIEHASPSALVTAPRDVLDELGKVKAIIYFAERLVPQLEPFAEQYGEAVVPFQRSVPD